MPDLANITLYDIWHEKKTRDHNPDRSERPERIDWSFAKRGLTSGKEVGAA